MVVAGRLRQAGAEAGPATDVVGLLAVLQRAAGDHVGEPVGVDAAALDEVLQGRGEQVGRVVARELAASAADRGPDGVDDHGFAGLAGLGHARSSLGKRAAERSTPRCTCGAQRGRRRERRMATVRKPDAQ